MNKHDVAMVDKFIEALSTVTNDPTMSSQQQRLLLALYVHGATSQSKLEELTGVKSASNSRNIAKLGKGENAWEGTGPDLVENIIDLHNRRTKVVQLTPKGRALVEECWKRSFGTYVSPKTTAPA